MSEPTDFVGSRNKNQTTQTCSKLLYLQRQSFNFFDQKLAKYNRFQYFWNLNI